ncbi:sulfatase-like hydrolase/transferase [Aphanothece sacrum]|uniref:Sulfatase n=1 Tax=Aphanothece sacrum FPU1 TaxID=1920663 RepID=A0A401IEU3_APHSA|nr:sulfatase-like hydrolase/transferase [Aphanothece sacrum]GBF79812.1 sulfatase [Aphanothece sacrum FPU1]GBF84824.1 sulfatase [Aphanothece sacrum FPU3]
MAKKITELFGGETLPNIVLIITDQQRALQHFPDNFIDRLPALQQLTNQGLSFEQAFTATCACAPSRATFLTSQYPAKHKTTNTGQMSPIDPLDNSLDNLAKVLERAGYKTRAWFGKWHLGWVEDVPEPEKGIGPVRAGFSEWGGEEAGITISDYKTLGGGTPNYDQKYLDQMLNFIDNRQSDDPFCLVASFVNPHDGFVAHHGLTSSVYGDSGYPESTFTGSEVADVSLPPNFSSSLLTAPRAQAATNWWNIPYSIHTPEEYVKFYAHLQCLVDVQIKTLLDKLAENEERMNNTLIIRFADHGEMGMSHGMLEKFFNAYEESIRIPLVFSNPEVWPTGQKTQSLVSLVDLAPTLASLLKVEHDSFDGEDLTPILENPGDPGIRELIHFTYDDNPAGTLPSIVRMIRTDKWKYAVYCSNKGTDADWELYDLEKDHLEEHNLAGKTEYIDTQSMLNEKLERVMSEMGTTPEFWPPQATEQSRGIFKKT